MKTKKEITDIQFKFLLNYFFKNEKYPGWESIARKLIVDGSVNVAGDKCIWWGGVGNFIKTEPFGIGCLTYKFDLDEFMESLYYQDIRDQYVAKLFEKMDLAQREYEEISVL